MILVRSPPRVRFQGPKTKFRTVYPGLEDIVLEICFFILKINTIHCNTYSLAAYISPLATPFYLLCHYHISRLLLACF